MDQLLASREQADRMKTLADDVAVAFEARLTDVVGRRLDEPPRVHRRPVSLSQAAMAPGSSWA